jgi:hypothetical protein
MQVTDAELVEAFLGQDDRRTYSGKMLSDCFSPTQFDLAFQYGSVVQRSAIRHALIACLSCRRPTRGRSAGSLCDLREASGKPACPYSVEYRGRRAGRATGTRCRQLAGGSRVVSKQLRGCVAFAPFRVGAIHAYGHTQSL